MQFRVVLFTLVTWVLATSLAHAQISRGGGIGAARGGGQAPARGGSMSQVAPRARVPGSQTQIIIQQSVPSNAHHRTAGVMGSRLFGHVPSLRVARTPPHHHFFPHRPRHFFKPRGIVIIEVPRFYGTTVTSQYFPGSRWVEPPFAGSPLTDSRAGAPGQLAPFDPTPEEVVQRMLALAGVKKDDVVYDLGSGDGRVVLAAAQKYGARAVGFEIDPGLVKLARENVRKHGLQNLVEIRQQDFMSADLSPATVVTMYLSQDGNAAVKPRLLQQLKPGARVVSYTFDMGDWTPKIIESYRDAAGDTHLLYYWEISEPGLS